MTDEERRAIVRGEIPGPVWTDMCDHGGYIASFECWNGRTEEKIDMYVFESPLEERDIVCLRYGNGDSEYYSPGSPYEMGVAGRTTNCELYKRAMECLLARGKMKWIRNPKPSPDWSCIQ